MPKERSINPAQAQRKAEKARAVRKGAISLPRALESALTPLHSDLPPSQAKQIQARRNEKLARRNPERLQKQLDDLKAIEGSGGKLTAHENTALENLEKDLQAVRKAREALGDAAPKSGSGGFRNGDRDGGRGGFGGGRGGGVLGKRRRDDEEST
jgi:hypothetical protein